MSNTSRYISIILTVLLLPVLRASGVGISFTGESRKSIEVTPERNTGLEHLYVVWDSREISSMRINGVGRDLSVSRYSNLGGGYAEPITISWDGTTAVVENPEGNMGYILTENGRNTCIWIVDYSTRPFDIRSLDLASEQDCDNTKIETVGEGQAIHYYTIDGRQEELSREIKVSYYTEVWDEASSDYSMEQVTKAISNLPKVITLTPPLYCSTAVTVTGDRFLEEWGISRKAESQTLIPNGIAAQTIAEQLNLPDTGEDADPSNVINGETSGEGLGGSAPAIIKFTAVVTEAVIHDEWQMSRDPEFSNYDYRFTDREVEYTFEEEGTYYMRYVGSNADGSCNVYGDTYTIAIGASDLRIPNAFTPNDDGINDVWKVAYRSLLDFKCWIFDRYGNELFHFTDPSQGWDGKHKGKTVKPGVYYYVIEARGSDGTKYKKSGDINIINYKKLGTSTGSTE